MVNKCFPHMIQDECVQTRKCTADDKTQRQTGPESNDLGGQWANDACTPSFMYTDTCVHMPRIHPLNHPHRAEIRTPRNTFNLVHSCSWMCLRICGLLNLIHSSGKSKETWLVFGNDVQFHFPNFPEVLLCCHYSHPKVQISPRPSQHSTSSFSFCSPG